MPWPPRDLTVRDALLAAWEDGSWGSYDSGHVRRLEARLAEMFGFQHVLTCGSGTLAVEVCLRAAGCEAGTEAILAAYDYPGNFLSVHATGAMPRLVDVGPSDNSPIPEAVREALNERTRAVIVSHLHGGLADISAIRRACAGRAVVLEDAAQCPGTRLSGDLAVLSFGGSKLLSAGRGGAILTNDGRLAQRARLALGRGNNLVAPLSELQAIVLLPQLEALADRNRTRGEAVRLLKRHLPPGMTLFEPASTEGEPGYYKVGMRLDPARLGVSREHLVSRARQRGVALDEGFPALHVGRSPKRYLASGSLEGAERAGRETIILHHPVLLEGGDALLRMASILTEVHEEARHGGNGR
jgi:dTDP-4-amino-4,6-dideoxygalactose transaminase